MKSLLAGLGAMLTVGLVVLLGCGEHHHKDVVVERQEVGPPPPGPEVVVVEPRPAGVIIVDEPPPPLRVERRPGPPGRDYVWIAGYWSHGEHGYVWVSGHYVRPPHNGARWVPDRWDRHADGHRWEYKPGHWEK